ncbi:MAG: hypothetical protein FWD34_06810 [Oscillospiraceae bacterium]|nr:hypothetical protein [Oscillospiraceae bacterium]
MFFKKKETKPPIPLPNKKTVQFEPVKMNSAELDTMLRGNLSDTLLKTLVPANYYQNKLSWLDCELRYNDDYSVVYVRLIPCINDKQKGSTAFYQLDYELLRGLLRRFGQNI